MQLTKAPAATPVLGDPVTLLGGGGLKALGADLHCFHFFVHRTHHIHCEPGWAYTWWPPRAMHHARSAKLNSLHTTREATPSMRADTRRHAQHAQEVSPPRTVLATMLTRRMPRRSGADAVADVRAAVQPAPLLGSGAFTATTQPKASLARRNIGHRDHNPSAYAHWSGSLSMPTAGNPARCAAARTVPRPQ